MTSDQPTTESSNSQTPSQQEMGLMLQRRALYQMERAKEKPPRSPKQIALVLMVVVITMSLFLAFVDKGVKVAHRVIDIWTPVILEANKPAAPTAAASASSSESGSAYMIKVEPTPPAPANTSSSNTQSSNN